MYENTEQQILASYRFPMIGSRTTARRLMLRSQQRQTPLSAYRPVAAQKVIRTCHLVQFHHAEPWRIVQTEMYVSHILSAFPFLYNALRHHGLSHFHEAGHIGTADIVDVTVGLCAVLDALFVDFVHNLMQFFIHLFGTP